MNLCKTQILNDSQANVLFEQMANPTIEIQDFNIVDDRHLMLTTKRTSEDMCDPGHTNVFFWPHLLPAGPDLSCTNYWICYKPASCTGTQTR